MNPRRRRQIKLKLREKALATSVSDVISQSEDEAMAPIEAIADEKAMVEAIVSMDLQSEYESDEVDEED